jgi:7,8-dihydroneopterin aldolase/epimerase/oxygenase
MHRELYQQIRRESDRIGIEGIQFYAYHGHLQEEHALGQRFELAIQAYLDLSKAGESDDLTETLNYQALHALATDWVTAHRFHLLEALAQGLAKEIFSKFPILDAIKLCVRKLSPPIPNFFGHVEIEVTRVHPRHLKRSDESRTRFSKSGHSGSSEKLS